MRWAQGEGKAAFREVYELSVSKGKLWSVTATTGPHLPEPSPTPRPVCPVAPRRGALRVPGAAGRRRSVDERFHAKTRSRAAAAAPGAAGCGDGAPS